MPASPPKESLLIKLSLSAIMAALVCVATLLIRIPNPMGGYFNVGDVLIFVSALVFGPIVGGVAGGLGSALADLIGFPVFAPFTLVVKGVEGVLAGLIMDKKNAAKDVLAVVAGGLAMILGYFLTEVYLWGVGGALAEVPANVGQVVIGGVVGIPIALVLRRRLPEIMRH